MRFYPLLRFMLPLKRYGGDLVHCRRDDQGVIEVVDTAGVRSLHFGNRNRQSALCLANPKKVELSYIRAMLLNLVFRPDPGRVLILGLGGGSLANFFLRHFPDVHLVVVEYRPAVIEVARRFFTIPESPQLELHVGDCRAFIRQAVASGTPRYDHIYIDAFDMEGLSPSVNQTDFFESCERLLLPGGSLAINLWGHHRLCLNYSLKLLSTRFAAHSLYLSVPHKENVIGFGLSVPGERNPEEEQQRAIQLQEHTGLELPSFLDACTPIPLSIRS